MLSPILLLLVAVVVVIQADVNITQIHALKALSGTTDANVYMTCNIIFFKQLVDYDMAENKCRDFKYGMGYTYVGTLATVNDEEKNTEIKTLLNLAYNKYTSKKNMWAANQWVWTGLRKTKNNYGFTHTTTYNTADWEWATGENPYDFHMWMRKMPDQRKQKKHGIWYYQNQMRIDHDGQWDDTFTYKEHPYACDYKGKYILGMNFVTWHHAKKECNNAGLILGKVQNGNDLNELKRLFHVFLGSVNSTLEKFDKDNWLWLGGNDFGEEGVWHWTDGEALNKFYGMEWTRYMPDNAEYIGTVGQQVLSIARWGQFDDSFDHTRKRRFVCQCPGTEGEVDQSIGLVYNSTVYNY